MRKLVFRICEAIDGRTYAFLSDQPDMVDCFDNGYKVAYKDIDGTGNSELLARWKNGFTVESPEFDLVPEAESIPQEMMDAFSSMMAVLIKGVDVMFCDYNLGIEGDLPMCNDVMDRFTSTDFVLFSCAEIIGEDPAVQPYIVAYALPRYQSQSNTALQHRVYCKTSAFAFRQAINAIISQRKIDNLAGGHIRSEQDYIAEPTVTRETALREVNEFTKLVKRLAGGGLLEDKSES